MLIRVTNGQSVDDQGQHAEEGQDYWVPDSRSLKVRFKVTRSAIKDDTARLKAVIDVVKTESGRLKAQLDQLMSLVNKLQSSVRSSVHFKCTQAYFNKF